LGHDPTVRLRSVRRNGVCPLERATPAMGPVRSPPMWFCDECGRPAEGGDPPAADPPVCPEHGPRWRLVRNATCAEVLVERDGCVLLGRRGREPFAGMWEIPGG